MFKLRIDHVWSFISQSRIHLLWKLILIALLLSSISIKSANIAWLGCITLQYSWEKFSNVSTLWEVLIIYYYLSAQVFNLNIRCNLSFHMQRPAYNICYFLFSFITISVFYLVHYFRFYCAFGLFAFTFNYINPSLREWCQSYISIEKVLRWN